MSDRQEALKNGPPTEPAAEFERTLSALQRQFHTEIHKTQQQKSSYQDAVPNRDQVVEGHLSKARDFYRKKEWARAFAEWDQVCAFLEESDDFRKRVTALRESHENLMKVNREVIEIKGVLSQRSAPRVADKKFVQGAHEEVSTQVRNVYSYLGQQLRAERTPKTLSFWWPVLGALILLALGAGALVVYHDQASTRLRHQNEQTDQTLQQRLAILETENAGLSKKLSDERAESDRKIEELKQQNAGWRNAGREKIEELEVRLNDSQKKNEELNERLKGLLQGTSN